MESCPCGNVSRPETRCATCGDLVCASCSIEYEAENRDVVCADCDLTMSEAEQDG